MFAVSKPEPTDTIKVLNVQSHRNRCWHQFKVRNPHLLVFLLKKHIFSNGLPVV